MAQTTFARPLFFGIANVLASRPEDTIWKTFESYPFGVYLSMLDSLTLENRLRFDKLLAFEIKRALLDRKVNEGAEAHVDIGTEEACDLMGRAFRRLQHWQDAVEISEQIAAEDESSCAIRSRAAGVRPAVVPRKYRRLGPPPKVTRVRHVSERIDYRFVEVRTKEGVKTVPAQFAKVIRAPRSTNAWYRSQASVLFGTGGPIGVHCQSGGKLEGRRTTRLDRDQAQIGAAKAKVKAEYKALPKDERKKRVLSARDKRNPACVLPQSGRALAVAGGVVAGFALSKLTSLMRKSEKLVDNANKFFETLKSIRDNFKSQLGRFLWAIPFVMTAYYFLEHVKGVNGPVAALVVAALARLLDGRLWNHIVGFFRKDDIGMQSGIQNAAKLLSTVLTFSIFKGRMTASKITELTKRVSMLERATSGWEAFITWVVDAIEACVNWVSSVFGSKKRVQLIKKANQPVIDWARRVDDMVLRVNTCEDVDPKTIDEMVQVCSDGHALKEFFRGTPVANSIDVGMAKMWSLITPYQGVLNARNNFRIEPECIVLTGKPGIGKTILIPYICSVLMKHSGLIAENAPPDEVKKNMWQKTGKYWNSYSGQLAMILDDAHQWKGDPTDPENDFMTYIRSISNWSFPLEFADVNSKGKNFFRSSIVLVTCNNGALKSTAELFVHSADAVVRRMHHPYTLELKEQYQTPEGRLDYNLYNQELRRCIELNRGIDSFPWHMWQVRKHDFLTGRDVPYAIPLKDMVLNASMALRRKIQNHGQTEADLDSFITNYSVEVETVADEITVQSGRSPASEDDSKGSIVAKGMSLVKQVKSDLKNYLADASVVSVFCDSVCTVIAGVVGLAIILRVMKIVCKAVWSLIMTIFKPKSGKPRAQSNHPKSKAKHNNRIVAQSGDSVVATNVYNNSYKAIIDVNGGVVMGQVLFVNDTLAVQCEHYSSALLKGMLDEGSITGGTIIKFMHASQAEFSFEVTVERFRSYDRWIIPDRDVEFVNFKDVRAHRNITNTFITEKQIRYVDGTRCRIDICDFDKQRWETRRPLRKVYVLDSMSEGRNLRYEGRKLERYFEYRAPTVSGECGAPVSLYDPNCWSGHSTIGLHCAGNENRSVGICNIITLEMVQEARSKLGTVDDKFQEDLASRGVRMQSGDRLPFTSVGSFLPIGELERPVVLCPRSSYYKTELYGVFGEYDYLPAPMRPIMRGDELVLPMNNAVAPYSSPVRIFDVSKFKHYAHIAYAPLAVHTNKTVNKRIFTFEEAVCGIPERKFRAIPRQTSAGFPYCYWISSGKTDIFGDDVEYDLTTPMAKELRQRVEHMEAMAKRGERSAVLFNDFLKDELRSRKKVDAVATRLISSAPLDYVVLWRMYFGDFSSRFMENHTDIGMAPGICAYTDWDKLARKLSSRGTKVFAGDFKSFDSSLQPCVMQVILDYINEWYNDGPENALVRRVLWCDLLHSRHVGGDGTDQRYVYQWAKSLPSGHPFTTIINSMYSLIMLVACYVGRTGDWSHFWNKCFAVTYGDDNVVNVSDDVAEVFNQVTVAEEMAKYGMVYTSDVKDGELSPYTDLQGVTFLKRGFLEDDGHWNAALDLDSFLYCVYWCKNKRLEAKIRQDELENALEELSLHTQAVWDKYAPAVYEVLRRYKLPNAPCDRQCYLRIVRARADNWY